MHDEETWLWRIQWAGRWCNSRHQCTEEQIRKEHPEATRIEGSRRIQSLPDSQEEKDQLQYNNTSAFLSNRPRPDGSTMLLSEYPVVDR